MKAIRSIAFFIVITGNIYSQELFVLTEPASNMPAKSLGIRASNWLMFEKPGNAVNYHVIPELMWGINSKWMLHAEGFFSSQNSSFMAEGGGLYIKYRFLSQDDVFKHFRMAAFGRASANNGDIHQQEIEINGHNTGYEAGLIATQLLHKVALSTTISHEHAFNNFQFEFPKNYSERVLNYSFSAGRLMHPKTYTDYKQININFMVEVLGQTQIENGKMFLDIAPSIQFIVNSQTRIDIAYKHSLYNDMIRTAPNGFLFRIDHLLFNVF